MGCAEVLDYARRHRDRFVRELQHFVQIPSVSAQPEHAAAVRRCAEWLARHLRAIGMQRARVVATARHPIVYAEWHGAPGRPTLLVYGHYDVQPADPLAAWRDPPFAATVRGQTLYGRGASDDKGQLWAHVKALEAYLGAAGSLPVNIVCIFDGEEEIGSPNLLPFLTTAPVFRAVDVAVLSDTRFRARGRPAIIYGLRGNLAMQVELRGPPGDLHSGAFGGAIHNPIEVLCGLLAGLHDRHGRIAMPGFYDRVCPVNAAERAYLRCVAPPDATILREAGVARGWGERGYSLYERTTIRPALSITGIAGGYSGSGSKSIVPSRAAARLSFRLVPDQDPREVEQLFRRCWARSVPPALGSRITTHSRAAPALLDPRHAAIQAAVVAYEHGFGAAPVLLRSGGTIPVVNTFASLLGLPTVLLGLGLPDDRAHAPNEKFELRQLWSGIDTLIWYLHLLGTQPAPVGRRRQASRYAGAHA